MGESPRTAIMKTVPDSVSTLRTFLAKNQSIEFIRFQWVDFCGVLSARVATTNFASSLAQKNAPISLPSPIQIITLIDGGVLFEDVKLGIDGLWPDWSSLKVCHYYTNHAQVMCFVEEDMHGDGESIRFRRCPRWRLLELTKSVKIDHDIDFLVGVEVEFMIMEESQGGLQPAKMVDNVYSTASLNNKYLPVLEEIVNSISQAGIEVRQFHSEGSTGLFEISLEPLSPLQSADALIYSKEAIKTTCFKHGLRATMFPKPFEKLSGIGIHHHLSISPKDNEESFLAGLLENWKSLAAFYMPNYDSYSRVRPNQWITWGLRNKTATINKVHNGHWELRSIDGTTNPYLTMLAILSAGMQGLEKKTDLVIKNLNKIMLVGFDSQEAADEFAVKEKMPTSLKESISSLKGNKCLTDALGPEILGRYIRIKTKEEEIFSKMIGSERREISMRVF
jgi:glutamine synthetase